MESSNTPPSFTVDASRAGLGDIEVGVQLNNKKIPVKQTNQGNAVYRIQFMPKQPRRHMVFVSFSGETVPGELF